MTRHIAFLVGILLPITVVQAQVEKTKVGGVCFRVDDNQDIAKLTEYARLFNKYGLKFSAAMNLAAGPTADYFYTVPALQEMGHEIMDHSPNHLIQYFTTYDTARYSSLPGVDHITGNKICLSYRFVDSVRMMNVEGIATVDGDRAISKDPGAFKSLSMGAIGLYFPTFGLYMSPFGISASNSADVDTLYLRSYWAEPIAFPGKGEVGFHIVRWEDVEVSDDGLKLMAERTMELARIYGLQPPRTWIQPGGWFPMLGRPQVKRVFGEGYGYLAGAVYPQSSFQVFNEHDPNHDARYGMMWGDFYEDSRSFAQVKGIIADRVAKHHMVIGHSHFKDLLGGWSGYMSRMDSLLAWCKVHSDRIVVATYAEWADRLYGRVVNPYENIFPSLTVDLDENNIPDGYYDSVGWTDGQIDSTDGAPGTNEYSYSIGRLGSICYVSALAGLEKGENEFSIWTKGSPLSTVEVSFRFPGLEATSFRFPAGTDQWTRYTLSQSKSGAGHLIVPDSASTVSVRIICSAYGGGKVKVSGMTLRKKTDKPLKIISVPPTVATEGAVYRYDVQVNSAATDTSLRYELTLAPAWLHIEQTGIVSGMVPRGSTDSLVAIIVRDTLGNSESQQYTLRIVQSDPNGSVRFLSQPDTLITPGHPYEYQPEGNSIYSGDQLTYKLLTGPTWLSVSGDGVVRGVAPNEYQSVPVRLMLQDQHGGVATQSYQLQVSQVLVDDFESPESPTARNWFIASGAGTLSAVYDAVVRSRVLWVQSEMPDDFRADCFGNWKASTFSVKVSSTSDFTLYVWVIDTTGKSFYVQYKPGKDEKPVKTPSSVIFSIDNRFSSGWHLFTRDINADLRIVGWEAPVAKISMISVRGGLRVDDIVVGASTQEVRTLMELSGNPTDFSVSTAFPNPFNASTSMLISQVTPRHVYANVYDIGGRLVDEVLDESLPPGRYVFTWNAGRFASGTYFCRIKVGDVISIRKFILVK